MSKTTVKDYKRDFGGEVNVPDGDYHPSDDLQTPPYALAALSPYIPASAHIAWEPAVGDGLLAQALVDQFGLAVIKTGIEENFFECEPPPHYDLQVTNPPWGKKYKWLKRSLKQRKPFALLLPGRMIFAAKAIHLIENSNLEIIQIYPRVGYLSCNMTSFLKSRPQLDSCWVTWGLNVGRRLTYTYIGEEKKQFLLKLKAELVGQPALF